MASVPNSGPAAPPPPPVWEAQATGAAQVAYGGFWIRLVAYIIDAILLTLVVGGLGAILGFNLMETDVERQEPLFNLVSVVIGWLYFALMESSERGATVGKMALGLRVVTSNGQRLSFMNATGRYFAKIISGLILMIGYLMVAWDGHKQGLHDKIAGTYVIRP